MMQLAILTTTVLIIKNQLLQTTLPGDATSNRPLILPVFTLMPPRGLLMGENLALALKLVSVPKSSTLGDQWDYNN